MLFLYIWAICTINQPCELEMTSPHTNQAVVYEWWGQEQDYVVSTQPGVRYIWHTPGEKWVIGSMSYSNISTVIFGQVKVQDFIYLPMVFK